MARGARSLGRHAERAPAAARRMARPPCPPWPHPAAREDLFFMPGLENTRTEATHWISLMRVARVIFPARDFKHKRDFNVIV